jgi:hypothetical protein
MLTFFCHFVKAINSPNLEAEALEAEAEAIGRTTASTSLH